MPIYTYRCESCGVQFERHQSFHDSPLTTCPECRKKSLKKVMTPVGIVFKGSGFYATDHKSPSGQVPRTNKKEKENSCHGVQGNHSRQGNQACRKRKCGIIC